MLHSNWSLCDQQLTCSQLPIHYRFLRDIRSQRTCVGDDDPLRCFGWNGNCCYSILQEYGCALHSDDHGLSEFFNGTFAIRVLQIWTLDQKQVETCNQAMIAGAH
jgi:hypothetical protein